MSDIDYRSIPLRQEPTIPDQRNWDLSKLIPQTIAPTEFPKSFRKTRTHPLGSQYSTGCCVAFSARHGREPIEQNQTGKFIPLSHMSLYYNRKDSDWQGSGMIPEQAYKALRDFGMAELSVFDTQKEYPYGKTDFLSKKDEILKNSYPHRISAFAQIDINNENEFKTALMNPRICLTLEIPIYESFYRISKSNPIAPIPDKTEKLFGYHMVCCDGWNDNYNGSGKKVKIIANSWGTNFGIDGFFYLPEGFPVIVTYALTDNYILGNYSIKLTSDKSNVKIGNKINMKIKTFNNNSPLANQKTKLKFKLDGMVLTSPKTYITDKNGEVSIPSMAQSISSQTYIASWEAPDGNVYDSEELKLTWENWKVSIEVDNEAEVKLLVKELGNKGYENVVIE